jgi:hypothetical protein
MHLVLDSRGQVNQARIRKHRKLGLETVPKHRIILFTRQHVERRDQLPVSVAQKQLRVTAHSWIGVQFVLASASNQANQVRQLSSIIKQTRLGPRETEFVCDRSAT